MATGPIHIEIAPPDPTRAHVNRQSLASLQASLRLTEARPGWPRLVEAADKELRAAAFAHGYKAGKPADTRRRLCRAAERYAAALRVHCDAFLSLQA